MYFREGLDSIFDGPCKKSQNHAVVLVGYGTSEEHGIDYWVNSIALLLFSLIFNFLMAVVIVFRLYATVGAMTGRRVATYKIKFKRFNLLIFKSKYYFFLNSGLFTAEWICVALSNTRGLQQPLLTTYHLVPATISTGPNHPMANSPIPIALTMAKR